MTGAQILQRMTESGVVPSRLVSDSRQIQAGDTFIAYPGETSDGRHFIGQAIANGASSVVWDDTDFNWESATPNFPVAKLRERVGEIASAFYQEPSRHLWVIGITGTNGKTSCSHWLAQALNQLGRKTAIIGTLGNGFPGHLSHAINTTPDPILLHGSLANYLAQGAAAVAMEVSSHALAQGRVNGMKFDVAMLTNLSRDHLDFHGDMTAYGAAKRLLFGWPQLKATVLNMDDPFGAELAAALETQAIKVMTYGFRKADIRASRLELSDAGLSMTVTTPFGSTRLSAAVVGRFNAYNLLAVLAVLLTSDISLEDAVNVLARVTPVPGRMQQLGGGDLPLVVVDYAHTPDALEKVLSSLREQCQGRLICVFGCGGNRDKGKRPLMGKAVSALADFTLVTSDNPRHEDPQTIIAQVLAGVSGKHGVEPDRAKAINSAIQMAKTGDVVLLAGKGHEDTQQIGDAKLPFSDALMAAEALNKRKELLS